MHSMKAVFSLAGAMILLVFPSCATMPVLPELAGVTFQKGELVANLNADIYASAEAVQAAGYRLQLAPVLEVSDLVQARMVAYDPHGTRVVLRLRPIAEEITEVRIKSGVSGDEAYSRRIFSEIRKKIP